MTVSEETSHSANRFSGGAIYLPIAYSSLTKKSTPLRVVSVGGKNMSPHEYMVREGIELSLGLSRPRSTAPAEPARDEYVLATGTGAVHRLWLLHGIYS